MMSRVSYFASCTENNKFHSVCVSFSSRREAEEVFTWLDELLSRYSYITVADVYDMVGESCIYIFNKYGWSDLGHVSIERRNGAYIMRFGTDPHYLGDSRYDEKYSEESGHEPKISIDVIVTIDGKKYKLVPVDD